MQPRKCFAVFALLSIGLLATAVYAETGVSQDKIILGQSCALSGPAQALGTGMKAGLDAAFAKINDEGGIHGRTVSLTTKDDGYEPNKAIENTRALIDDSQVFLLIGEVGTPTSKAVVPIVEEASVPFLGPFTGAEFLRNPFKPLVVNVRGSYNQEMERHAQNLVDKKGLKKIACFYQNDGYGQAGLNGIKLALEKRGLELVATGTYERNSTAVRKGLLAIRKANPDAVIMVGAYKPCAEFIKLAKKVGMKKTIFCNISFVGTDALKNELGSAGEGVIISQVVKFPYDRTIPLVNEFHEAMDKYNPDAKKGFVSLEGYMVGKLFTMIAKDAGADLTRDGFLSAIQKTKTFDLGGVALTYGPNDHQGMDDVYLTTIKGGDIAPE